MKSNKKKEEITVDVKEEYGPLNDKETKVFSLISWNGAEPKFDIRTQYVSKKDNKKHYGPGVALTKDEMDMLVAKYMVADSGSHATKEAVDFTKIFDSAEGITEKRKNGLLTQDGYVVLKKK